MPWTSLSPDSDFAAPTPAAAPPEGPNASSANFLTHQDASAITPPTALVVMRVTGRNHKPVMGRENESEEARARRIAADRERKRRQRNNETEEKRLKRKLADKEHKRFIRGLETLEERRARRLEQKMRRLERERAAASANQVVAGGREDGGMVGNVTDDLSISKGTEILVQNNPETLAALNLLAVGQLGPPLPAASRKPSKMTASRHNKPHIDGAGAGKASTMHINHSVKVVAEVATSCPDDQAERPNAPASTAEAGTGARGINERLASQTEPVIASPLITQQGAYI